MVGHMSVLVGDATAAMVTTAGGQSASVLVGVLAHDAARFSLFAASLSSLEMPAGSAVRWKLGVNFAENTNHLVRDLLASKHQYLWILGDDHAFERDVLNRLLARKMDIIVPICLRRWPPFQPVVCFSNMTKEYEGVRELVNLDDFPVGGLIQVHSAGNGGMLVHRHVFEEMHDPWFELGALDSEQLSEDIYFCDKAREAGFRIHCDLDIPFGHITSTIVWPQRREDGWSFGLGFPEGMVISMPPGTFQ